MSVVFNQMTLQLRRLSTCVASQLNSRLAPAAVCGNEHKCKLLVVGGGTGGCSVAWRFSRKMKDKICVLDGAEQHYYQPMFPLVAAGITPFETSRKPLHSVLPPNVCFVKDYAQEFDPSNCLVRTNGGNTIYYDFLVVAVGLVNDYHKIPGLKSALDDRCCPVSTIYSPQYCTKTWDVLRKTRGGHAIFTFPGAEAKCSGAAEKITYLADDYYRKQNSRHLFNITYNTGASVIFGVPKYAAALTRVAESRHVAVNCCCELVEVTPRQAVFRDSSGATVALPYNLLHVTPPMSAPAVLARSPLAADSFLDVDPQTLQHRRFPNVYGLGDCTNTPNGKTAAAAGRQSHVVEQNLTKTMSGQQATYRYDGYGACAMLTSYRAGILAEFLYDKMPYETFPIDQSKERRLFYFLKRHYFPHLYWKKVIKGKWDGPERARRFLRPLEKPRKQQK